MSENTIHEFPGDKLYNNFYALAIAGIRVRINIRSALIIGGAGLGQPTVTKGWNIVTLSPTVVSVKLQIIRRLNTSKALYRLLNRKRSY